MVLSRVYIGRKTVIIVAPSYTGDHSSSVLLDDFCCKLAHLDIDFALLFSILVRWAIVYVAQMKPLIVPILSEGE
ncbi:unnamed protein product [Prunus armeniaca]|uniref:Uncharacterized protein n=1 Tax=Prunus armeniaca TaxID=36596 RepID=A0A6J5UIY0_PRUAR|nr:unnamed protein product [Prunus armeniaca]CAB4306057.1 unnamed protein product [Prunus armeniaca]